MRAIVLGVVVPLLATTLLGCSTFGTKKLPNFEALKIYPVGRPALGERGSTQLECILAKNDYEVQGTSIVMLMHDCATDPVAYEEERRYLPDPIVIASPSTNAPTQFAPDKLIFFHGIDLGPGGVSPDQCVTFRCRTQYRDTESTTATLESRLCRGPVSQQRICGGAPS